MKPLVLLVFECSVCVASCVYTCRIRVFGCVCLLGIPAQPCTWLELGAWSCSSLAAVGLQDSAPPNNYIFLTVPRSDGIVRFLHSSSYNTMFWTRDENKRR